MTQLSTDDLAHSQRVIDHLADDPGYANRRIELIAMTREIDESSRGSGVASLTVDGTPLTVTYSYHPNDPSAQHVAGGLLRAIRAAVPGVSSGISS